jgi:ABC-type ATPase with predicted acetyltransferase domain
VRGVDIASKYLCQETDSEEFYVIDRHLDDSHHWMVGLFHCKKCGKDSAIVFRGDVEPMCPHCTTEQHRVTRRRVNAVEA